MRYKMLVEYDGTPFVGWQRQQSGVSVQSVLEKALKIICRETIEVLGSGRTDAGVHALGQVAHFDTSVTLDPFRLRESLNALVRPFPISVHSVEAVEDSFHARFSARQRVYLYRLSDTPFPPVLNQNRVWWYKHKLDETAMDHVAQLLIGKHDFSSFRASECQAKSPVKTLDEIHVYRQGEEVHMIVKARSFLHHQVRNLIGTLVHVGTHRLDQNDFQKILDAKDRRMAKETAPACGLYFVRVIY